jgi:hypothetical protein
MKSSSNATFLGVVVCRGETLPPWDGAAAGPTALFIGDIEVIVYLDNVC